MTGWAKQILAYGPTNLWEFIRFYKGEIRSLIWLREEVVLPLWTLLNIKAKILSSLLSLEESFKKFYLPHYDTTHQWSYNFLFHTWHDCINSYLHIKMRLEDKQAFHQASIALIKAVTWENILKIKSSKNWCSRGRDHLIFEDPVAFGSTSKNISHNAAK